MYSRFLFYGSGAVLTLWRIGVEVAVGLVCCCWLRGTKSARTLDDDTCDNINPESTCGGMQRTLEDFQFDPENTLNMSQLTGMSTEELKCGNPDDRDPQQHRGQDCSRSLGDGCHGSTSQRWG